MRIQEYYVNIEWTKPKLMQFLALVPGDLYKGNITDEGEFVGLILSTDLMEFLISEIPPISITYPGEEEIKRKINSGGKMVGEAPI